MSHVYKTKVVSSNLNGKTSYMCQYLQKNGRWVNMGNAQYPTQAGAEDELIELQKQSPSYVYTPTDLLERAELGNSGLTLEEHIAENL